MFQLEQSSTGYKPSLINDNRVKGESRNFPKTMKGADIKRVWSCLIVEFLVKGLDKNFLKTMGATFKTWKGHFSPYL